MKFFDINDNKILKISIICLPFLFIFSRFLLDFYISSLSLFFIINYFFIKKIDLKNIFIKILFIFYIYILINSFFSFDLIISFEKSIPYFRFIFYSIVLTIIFSKDIFSTEMLLKSFLITHTLLFIDSSIQFFLGFNIFGYDVVNGRVSSFFFDELILGSYISKTLPLILSLLFINKEKYSPIYQYYLIIISMIMTFYSAERVGFISCVLMSLFYIFITTSLKKFFILFLFCLLSIYTISFLPSKNVDRLFDHTYTQIKSSTNNIWPSFRHEIHADTAIKMFKDKLIFGQGFYSFRYLCSEEKFIPKEKIKNKNIYFSPEDGIFLKIDDVYSLMLKDNSIIQLTSNGYYFYIATDKLNKEVKKNDKLFSTYEYKDGCNTHPHNYHLQFLSEIGIIGYSFLFIFIIYLLFELIIYSSKKLLSRKSFSHIEKGYLIIVFGLFLFIFPFFPSGNFFNNWLSIIFYTNLSIFLLYKNKLNL